MIESETSITLTAEDAANPQVVATALQRAQGLGIKLIYPGGDLCVTPDVASNHPLYQLALAEAQKRGGIVRVVAVSASSEKDVHITRAQGSDHREYMKAQEQAAKQGGTVIVD